MIKEMIAEWDSGYRPGEPYEFLGRLGPTFSLVPRYRCFRHGCKGSAVMVADRNTHNAYHNKRDAWAKNSDF